MPATVAVQPSYCTTPLPYSIGETNHRGLSWTVQHPTTVLHCGFLPVSRKGTHPSSYPRCNTRLRCCNVVSCRLAVKVPTLPLTHSLWGLHLLIYLPIGLESRLYPSFPLFYLSLSFSSAPFSCSKYLHAVSTSPVDVAPGFYAAVGY